jgi:hypothetical protein
MPAYMKSKRNSEGGEPSSKRPKYHFNSANDEVTMLTDDPCLWKLTSEAQMADEDVSTVHDTARDGILVDTGASNVLMLVNDASQLFHYKTTNQTLSTAHTAGQLKIEGIGKVNNQTMYHTPDL